MRWLQWATADLQKGLGGVEVHARSLARELGELGISPVLSTGLPSASRELLTRGWDVVQTHGSAVSFWGTATPKGAIRIHTLHGTTLGRMAACGEWTWPGGYLATLRELFGVLRADIVLSIHSDLWLYRLAQHLGKVCAVCSNGWDSASHPQDHQDQANKTDEVNKVNEELPAALSALIEQQKPFWIFVGRGGDSVKCTERIEKIIQADPTFYLVAAPGEGFQKSDRILSSGLLTSAQVRTALKRASGLILTSLYEGLPLVVLEALAQGTPVLSTRVGGLKQLSPELQGLSLLDYTGQASLEEWIKMIHQLEKLPNDPQAREKRALWNRTLLWSWMGVAEVAFSAVRKKTSGRF